MKNNQILTKFCYYLQAFDQENHDFRIAEHLFGPLYYALSHFKVKVNEMVEPTHWMHRKITIQFIDLEDTKVDTNEDDKAQDENLDNSKFNVAQFTIGMQGYTTTKACRMLWTTTTQIYVQSNPPLRHL